MGLDIISHVPLFYIGVFNVMVLLFPYLVSGQY